MCTKKKVNLTQFGRSDFLSVCLPTVPPLSQQPNCLMMHLEVALSGRENGNGQKAVHSQCGTGYNCKRCVSYSGPMYGSEYCLYKAPSHNKGEQRRETLKQRGTGEEQRKEMFAKS